MLFGCKGKLAERTRQPSLVPVATAELPPINDDMDLDSLRVAAVKSLHYIEKLPAEHSQQFGGYDYSRKELIDSLHALLEIIDAKPSPEDLKRLLRERFTFYQSTGSTGQGDVLFTGYYVPTLEASHTRAGVYKYPLYRRPDDMLTVNLKEFNPGLPQKTLVGRPFEGKLVPYYTRHQIDCLGVLEGEGHEVAYLADPVDAFFLQIQGSGLVRFEDGKRVFVQYQAANGHPYRSIGTLLIGDGKMRAEDVSLFSLRVYLKEHLEEMEKILCYNESYTFFELKEDGPRGCLGEVLTAGRSIATDTQAFPKGALCLIITGKPLLGSDGRILRWEPFTRLVLNQDTGGAIKGPGRVDVFWGSGNYAETAAGYMKQPGKLFFLVKKHMTAS